MNLKPQDVLVLLKLVAIGPRAWTYASLAAELGMSSSQLHDAIGRVLKARLAVKRAGSIVPRIRNLEGFLIHGLPYVFVPERGAMTRGLPTSHAASPLVQKIVSDGEPPPVWPDPGGEVRGITFSPLCKCAPHAARADPALYELLALVDAIRDGRARERAIAARELKQRLGSCAR